ncbi:MAG: condensation domain-containing protein, partial [Blastocatellia bacterium]
TSRLQQIANRNGLTLNTVVQGAWALLLFSYCSGWDVVFGVVVSGRSAAIPGMDSMTGLFINTLPARLIVEPHQPWLAWLREHQSRTLACRSYEFTPLSKIREWTGESLFDSIFVFENYPLDRSLLKAVDNLQVANVRSNGDTNYPLTFTATPGQSLELEISYSGARFEHSAISRMLCQMEHLLAGLKPNLSMSLGSVQIVTDAEHRSILATSFGGRIENGSRCVHELVAEQESRTPDSIAVVFEGDHVTFGELEQQSDRLTAWLISRGCRAESRVGICLERSVEYIIAVLAVMKAGGACIPIDPETPEYRRALVVEDSALALLMTKGRLVPAETAGSVQVLDFDEGFSFGAVAVSREERILPE